ncbi:hypothetical protein [Streptomyces sp. NPDC051569]|uniref:hypothetical protein n=1 Tax=Streptomyces sp. NPDC051569 TaxID=3365661 RepID=UPI00378FC8BD
MSTAVQHVERDSAASGRPVFVDASGRRNRRFRRVGWTVAAACSCYAFSLGGLLIGGDSGAPWLPIPAFAAEAKARAVPAPPIPAVRDSVAAPQEPVAQEESPTGSPARAAALGSGAVATGRPWTTEPGTPAPVQGREAAHSPAGTTGPRPGAAAPVTAEPAKEEPAVDEPVTAEPVKNEPVDEPAKNGPRDGSDGATGAPAPTRPGHPLGDLLGGVLGSLLG